MEKHQIFETSIVSNRFALIKYKHILNFYNKINMY